MSDMSERRQAHLLHCRSDFKAKTVCLGNGVTALGVSGGCAGAVGNAPFQVSALARPRMAYFPAV